MEVLWVRLEGEGICYYIGAIYHPPLPRPVYSTDHLVESLDSILEEISGLPDSVVILGETSINSPQRGSRAWD